MAKRIVSLSNELSVLMGALRGLRLLVQHWIESFGMDADIPHTIAALLVVLHERLRLLDRVAQGQLDPRLAWCPQNDAGSPVVEGEGARLGAWSERRLARHHRSEWKRLKARLRSKKRPEKDPSGKEGSS